MPVSVNDSDSFEEKEKTARLFDYIAKVLSVDLPVIRNLLEYKEQLWWLSDIPTGSSCQLRKLDDDVRGEATETGWWLKVKKTEIPKAPSLPKELQDWVELDSSNPIEPPKEVSVKSHEVSFYDDPSREDMFSTYSKKWQEWPGIRLQAFPELYNVLKDWVEIPENLEEAPKIVEKKNITEQFGDDPKRTGLLQEYKSKQWEPWAKSVMPSFLANQLYADLFVLHQRLQIDSERIEFLLGHALLTWKHKQGDTVKHFLFLTPIEINFNAEQRTISILPSTSLPTAPEFGCLRDLEYDNMAKIAELSEKLSKEPPDVWNNKEMYGLAQTITGLISPDGVNKYEEAMCTNPPVEKKPIIWNAPIFFVRPRAKKFWVQDAEQVRDAIKSNSSVPWFIRSLTANPSEKKPQNIESENISPETIPEGELLLPLPYNDEQKEITQRLRKHSGVLVQGPPGTGKSHTIANIICSLLAQGKRILVTAQTERALKVLRDKIPKEIQNLCISQLGSDIDSRKQIEGAVNEICRRIDRGNSPSAQANIEDIRHRLRITRERQAELRNAIRKCVEINFETLSLGIEKIDAVKAAQEVSANQQAHGWLPDKLSPSDEPPVTNRELEELCELLSLKQYFQKTKIPKINVKQTQDHNFPEYISGIEQLQQRLSKGKRLKGWLVRLPREANVILNSFGVDGQQIATMEHLEIVKDYVHRMHVNTRLEKLLSRLRGVVPCWTAQLEAEAEKDGTLVPPKDWQTAWRWSRLNSWLQQLHNRKDMDSLEKELEIEQSKEHQLVEKLVASLTWQRQIERVSPAQRQALIAWSQAIRRFGRGMGKHAQYHLAVARKEMLRAQEAVPVWIMPLHRVIQSFYPPRPDMFDVIIVDEASQCDLRALPVLYRGSRVLIIGDPEQISPESIGISHDKVFQLIGQHLRGIPHAERYDLQSSLYHIAELRLPTRTFLKEHFRSVPEIIEFSNCHIYVNDRIEPLRIPNPGNALLPSLKAIHVSKGFKNENNDVNEPEAEALVDKLVECCKDPKYHNKTMGVISLLGEQQAKHIHGLLRKRLDETELGKRKIICGDAYSFQGDERDVMFLSLVVANNTKFAPLIKETDKQRFNVAASRARDQVFLFHSVEPQEITNIDCMRYKLLNWYLKPSTSQMEEGLEVLERKAESNFEKDVGDIIIRHGYKVIQQYEVLTGKRIDLVVQGKESRLAVECDGDQWHGLDRWEADQRREEQLRRAGWTFWRVTASAFYRNPDKALSSLWEKLEKLKITPYF